MTTNCYVAGCAAEGTADLCGLCEYHAAAWRDGPERTGASTPEQAAAAVLRFIERISREEEENPRRAAEAQVRRERVARERLPREHLAGLVEDLLGQLDAVAAWGHCEECGGEGEHEADCALLAVIARAREASRVE